MSTAVGCGRDHMTPQADRRPVRGSELLDVFGPVELSSKVPDVTIEVAGPEVGPMSSSQGTRVVADCAYVEMSDPDMILVSGGSGTRPSAQDAEFLGRQEQTASSAGCVTSVCTGSALLAAAGALDGRRATSNKLAFEWLGDSAGTLIGSPAPRGSKTATFGHPQASPRAWT